MLELFKTNLPAEILKCLKQIEYGSIELRLPNGEIEYVHGNLVGPACQIEINDERFFSLILEKGDIGLGESYIEGYWTSTDIQKIIQFAILNKNALYTAIYGRAPNLIYYRLKHLLRRNSIKGSKKNISFHYDLGNMFYQSWLDETMTYSSALWSDEINLSLEDAQIKKYRTVLEKLEALPGDSILEIGCGWGGFAEYAAKNGYKVTGLTLSKEQARFAQERLRKQNIDAQVHILLEDYRDHHGKYDHVVSIEMLEAVGENFWDTYFSNVRSFLKQNGSVALQSIVIRDEDFLEYKKGTDFIQQYIFPGGMLPTISIIKSQLIKNGLSNIQHIDFGKDYARTLNIWDQTFNQKNQAIKEMGYNDSFLRMWHFYLKYCEGAFNSGQIDVSIVSARLIGDKQTF